MLTLLCCVQGHSFHLGCDWKVPVPLVQSTITWQCVWVFHLRWYLGADMETDRISEPRMIQGSPLKINRQTVLHWSCLFIPASFCEAFHQNRLLRKVQHMQPHLLPQSPPEKHVTSYFPNTSTYDLNTGKYGHRCIFEIQTLLTTFSVVYTCERWSKVSNTGSVMFLWFGILTDLLDSDE